MSFAEQPAEAVVLYDADCGVCRFLLSLFLAWDRRRALRPLALQDPEARSLLAGVPPERWLDSWHLAAPGGGVVSAGAAVAPLLRMLPGGAALASLTERFPVAVERLYQAVATNRSRLSPFVPAAALRRADRLIAHRKGEPQPSLG